MALVKQGDVVIETIEISDSIQKTWSFSDAQSAKAEIELRIAGLEADLAKINEIIALHGS